MSNAVFPTTPAVKIIFGRGAEIYGPLINDIWSHLFLETYRFDTLDKFVSGTPEYKRRVYWTEILQRAHLAAVVSIVRGTRWIEVASREYEAHNLYGWAAACRSLIEAAGDTLHSLRRTPSALANNHHAIRADLTNKGINVMTSKDLEDDLIHFTHGRKIPKGLSVPDIHRAKQPWQYVKLVEDMQIAGASHLYSELCEIVHPAAASVHSMFAECDDGWKILPDAQSTSLEKLVLARRETLSSLLMACFNAPVLTLRVLHKFGVCKQIEPLRKYHFRDIPGWAQIDSWLRT